MGLLDRLFGRRSSHDRPHHQEYRPQAQYPPPTTHDGRLPDEQAIARYRYLLRTAPPEQIEQAHAEAFAQLTPDQRQQVLTQLAAAVPASERPRSDDADTLARVATRAEMRQPGTMERAFGGGAAVPGLGSMFLSTLAGAFVGSAIADAFFDNEGSTDGSGDPGDGGESADAGDAGADDWGGDPGGDVGGDFGGGDFGG
jgi:hypothetical protein